MDKRYLALILGELPRAELLVEAPLKKNVLSSGERLVRVDLREGKEARTRFRRLKRFAFDGRILTLVEAGLLTGRTHQIRVHAAHLGTPLAGDDKYGDPAANHWLKGYGLNRLFLHASALSFKLEYRVRPLRLECPLPAELQQVLGVLES
jgi:ribosomal large subunit pseudouridine synthase C (EC 5.4.99.-)